MRRVERSDNNEEDQLLGCASNVGCGQVHSEESRIVGIEEYSESLQPESINDQNDQYRSRKPKWWTQLAGRRGTRAQRQAIHRLTQHGYCIPKEILTEFSRMNNRSKRISEPNEPRNTCNETANGFGLPNDSWKRRWWNRALSILDPTHNLPEIHYINTSPRDMVQKNYTDKFQEMVDFKNILPDREYKEKWLEIGFGNGDNLLANARARNHILFMGSEIHQPGIGALAQKIEHGLTKDTAVDNIRIIPGHGIKLLSHLPDNYLDVILITFPDPWPRDIHARWRVIQTETIQEMKRVLSSDGRVFVATDDKCFDSWAREIFTKGSFGVPMEHEKHLPKEEQRVWKELIPCPTREEWLPAVSYYERKGINEGRRTMLQCWETSDL
ncbi:hypothetical protein HJC23_010740 [Cyclotella cryptica]|uniref:tRNA (guanine(46)-N(7))-methyltransferase n=1 Tax=Cyclotella cryptica TaxID=29204 RepID=A0ABD3Q0P9_9STRA|eukprot:CCRYP_011057-RA/>CCRYP_011057-RA protein AED:0.00 eAED:0.00 QI:43/-1/1/1/-1/1/1/34/383